MAGQKHFERFTGKDSKFYWRLRAANGNIIADGGQGYTHEDDRDKGIELVYDLGPDTPIEDVDE
jgi:uncharacterized protein